MKNNIIIGVILFIAGAFSCYFLMPEKVIKKTEVVENESDKKTIAELQGKISTLERTNIELQRKVKTHIVEKPDGSRETTIIEDTTQTETKEREITEAYEQKIAEYQHEINNLKSQLSETINKKYFAIEVGYDTTRSLYLHSSYDLFGRFFVGGHGQVGNVNSLGAGLGIKL